MAILLYTRERASNPAYDPMGITHTLENTDLDLGYLWLDMIQQETHLSQNTRYLRKYLSIRTHIFVNVSDLKGRTYGSTLVGAYRGVRHNT